MRHTLPNGAGMGNKVTNLQLESISQGQLPPRQHGVGHFDRDRPRGRSEAGEIRLLNDLVLRIRKIYRYTS